MEALVCLVLQFSVDRFSLNSWHPKGMRDSGHFAAARSPCSRPHSWIQKAKVNPRNYLDQSTCLNTNEDL